MSNAVVNSDALEGIPSTERQARDLATYGLPAPSTWRDANELFKAARTVGPPSHCTAGRHPRTPDHGHQGIRNWTCTSCKAAR